MTLTGKPLVFALLGAALAGVAAGSFLEGYRKARGLPPMEAAADAGVYVQVDAGVQVSNALEFHLGDWKAIPLLPRTRPAGLSQLQDAGSEAAPGPCVCPESFLFVPDVSLKTANSGSAEASGSAVAAAAARAAVTPLELRKTASIDLLATLGIDQRWGGDLRLGVRVLQDWWVVGGVGVVPAQREEKAEVRGGLGVRKEW